MHLLTQLFQSLWCYEFLENREWMITETMWQTEILLFIFSLKYLVLYQYLPYLSLLLWSEHLAQEEQFWFSSEVSLTAQVY